MIKICGNPPSKHDNPRKPKMPDNRSRRTKAGGSRSNDSGGGSSGPKSRTPREESQKKLEEALRRAEEARQQVKKEADDLESLLRDKVNLDEFDLKSMSDADRLNLLREIKKICDDYGLNTEKWNKSAAQDKIDKLVPDSQENRNNNLWNKINSLMSNPVIQRVLSLVLSISNFFLGKVPILGPILGFIMGIIDLFSDSIITIAFGVVGIIGAAAGLVSDVAMILSGTAPAKFALTLMGLILDVPELGRVFDALEWLYILWPEFTAALIALNIIFSKLLVVKDIFMMITDGLYIFLTDVLNLDSSLIDEFYRWRNA